MDGGWVDEGTIRRDDRTDGWMEAFVVRIRVRCGTDLDRDGLWYKDKHGREETAERAGQDDQQRTSQIRQDRSLIHMDGAAF